MACNQKNNRNPVTSYNEDQVARALETLREKNLTYVFYGSTSRVPKYKHVVPEVLHLSHAETAVMCVLMLRGPQTPGELRGNGSRFHEFSGLEEIEQVLNGLITRDEPMVVRLPRQPGQKEVRYAHLLSGDIDVEALAAEAERATAVAPRRSSSDQVEKLEQKVEALTHEVEQLKQQFEEFRKQFE
jgi:uncharacterized protein YceH (UPF0502 family)